MFAGGIVSLGVTHVSTATAWQIASTDLSSYYRRAIPPTEAAIILISPPIRPRALSGACVAPEHSDRPDATVLVGESDLCVTIRDPYVTPVWSS